MEDFSNSIAFIHRVEGYTQQARDIHPMLVHCWSSVAEGRPILYQYWMFVWISCLLG